ncbi:hypothetical protein DNTS_003348 [Danionella cerebrum]|uniref:Uncharacterized protein n=1 Tax=Danionella cerebrum TaxID=2873325 RepID=A0A553NLT4_9TELE|nr:hypothetical protein DNTS_003348 [Danionella translucida]TRY66379.1 hypothetical protein DNTS_003348 [Danionella translucida]
MPGDETKVVAVLLHDKWWPVCEVLKTSNKSRHGLVLVESLMERVVLFLLSQVVFGIQERSVGEDLYFSSYSLREHGKILWHDGEAVGFYTVKKRGIFCMCFFFEVSFSPPALIVFLAVMAIFLSLSFYDLLRIVNDMG